MVACLTQKVKQEPPIYLPTLLKGTAEKTPEQLEQEIELLGASLEASASGTDITISGTYCSALPVT